MDDSPEDIVIMTHASDTKNVVVLTIMDDSPEAASIINAGDFGLVVVVLTIMDDSPEDGTIQTVNLSVECRSPNYNG